MSKKLGGIFESNLSCILPLRIILLVLIHRYHYQSSSIFPNPLNQSDTYRIEESEDFHNSKGDIAG
jgi:hypothetical protein